MAGPSENSTLPSRSMEIWDIVSGFTNWRLWAFLGLQDIRQRYRRSSFGPLWLALGLGVTILGIGILYSEILKTSSGNYIPYIAISLLCWTFVSSVIIEATTGFTGQQHVISSVQVPYTSFILRNIVRNLIVAAHSIVVVVVAFVWFRYPITWVAIASVPGLFLVFINLYWIALLVGLVSTRYRDVAQIINYLMGIALFLTPVIWLPTTLRPGSPYLALNPLAQMLKVIRDPIFYHSIPIQSYFYLVAMFFLGMSLTLLIFFRSRKYLVYWL